MISFEEALKETEGKDKSVLLGNGFSIDYFGYKTLLDVAPFHAGDPIRKLFAALDTADFELVMRSLQDAAVVASVYGQAAQSENYEKDAARVREALIAAIRVTHPENRSAIKSKIDACFNFLNNFSTVFTLNYDLLLYWVRLESGSFTDGFGLGKLRGSLLGPFKNEAYCNVFNIHGGLHLFRAGDGTVEKCTAQDDQLIPSIEAAIRARKQLPIYVAEGTSKAKLLKINSNPYLRQCLEQLENCSGSLFVYGHSADDNDAHIYRAVFRSDIEKIYFMVHKPTADMPKINGQLAKYKASSNSAIEYTLVDSESAGVWAPKAGTAVASDVTMTLARNGETT